MPLLTAKRKKPPIIHTEQVEVAVKPKPKPKVNQQNNSLRVASSNLPGRRKSKSKSESPYPYPYPYPASPASSGSSDPRRRIDRDRGQSRKRKHGSVDPLQPHFDKDSDAEDDDDDDVFATLENRKRHRSSADDRIDHKRALTCADAFEPAEGPGPKKLRYIHATEIISTAHSHSHSASAHRALQATEDDDIRVQLQYPSLYPPESYDLLIENGKIDAVSDIIDVVTHVADFYLTADQATDFTEPNTGLIRRLNRASNTNDLAGFKRALADANARILSLAQDGTFRRNLSQRHAIPYKLAEFILSQVYDRTVSPDVDKLKQYKNGTDNVYGELNYIFVDKVLQEMTRMTSDQVFVDLGSGVGNVVFQAALEVGCESWGCEMMDNPCDFAEAQKREFARRCRLWGIAPGGVHLVRGDFLTEPAVHEVLKRADVVLVNNQAFTPDLNAQLVNMFLDLKQGCRIVSLKSFTHDDQGGRNINDVASNILRVEHHTYPEGHVSWTNAGGTFCISTRK
ncbi:DOT1-domain-containing protein [Sodiomyces alkalinus F11]|uniref:Histone-lysine N-methyltransferase, H3 lysine-79 specific n=1 Tax=Sodiomyces alkalinus (strain CBS 110278 / VKM F-3762 / F11) TaxID=1314773 RepID=A0A3N2PVB2_SODAK|nr:DOT1-domain-containing protein [Sodiomyces alkalinus F11]ROT38453.1 DOT1-domain-containing protein [Sodiomyces alkalinus F11]